jgi:hypothetical protein
MGCLSTLTLILSLNRERKYEGFIPPWGEVKL